MDETPEPKSPESKSPDPKSPTDETSKFNVSKNSAVKSVEEVDVNSSPLPPKTPRQKQGKFTSAVSEPASARSGAAGSSSRTRKALRDTINQTSFLSRLRFRNKPLGNDPSTGSQVGISRRVPKDVLERTTSTYFRFGVWNDFKSDNLLSMQWHRANDTSPRQKDRLGFIIAMLLSIVFLVGYFALFTFFPGGGGLFLNRGDFDLLENEDSFLALRGSLFASIATLALIYVLDLHNGGNLQQRTAYFLFLIALVIFFASLSFSFRDVVIIPFFVFFISAPLVATFFKSTFFPRMDVLLFIVGLIIPVYVVLGVSLIGLGYILPDNQISNDAVRTVYIRQAGCQIEELDFLAAQNLGLINNTILIEDFVLPDGVQDLISSESRAFNVEVARLISAQGFADEAGCTFRAQVLYHGPTIFIVVSVIVVWFMKELVTVSLGDRENRTLSNLSPALQVFLLGLSVTLFGAWIALTMLEGDTGEAEGSSFSLATLLLLASAILAVMLGYLAVSLLSIQYLKAQLNRTPIGKRVYQSVNTDFLKGAAVYFLAPVFLIWYILSVPTQMLRKYTFLGKRIEGDERKLKTKGEVASVWNTVKSWDLGVMLNICFIIGIAYFVVAVFIGRFTTVILAGLRVLIQDLDLPVATIIFVFIGLVMFLLPPVPGLPVYLAGGVILFSNARNGNTIFSSDFAALGYSIVANFFLKLLAVAAEQKVIGELYGSRSAGIRSIVGINSANIKAIRYILKDSGNIKAMVAILCGGPDWPTSVLTGILKLRLIPMLLGTFPVILLVACATAAGAFLVVDPETEDTDFANFALLEPLRGIFLAMTIVIQAVFFILAFHEIGKVVDTKPEVIDAIPDDLEVIEYEKENKAKSEIKKELKKWENLPTFWKVGHVIAFILFLLTNWTFQFGSTLCFVAIDPTSDPEVPFTTEGFVVLGIFCIPVIYFFVFGRYINKKTKQRLEWQEKYPNNAEEGNPKEDTLDI